MDSKVKVTTLTPDDSHVSFYGKAKVITVTGEGAPTYYLQSYETIVASYRAGVFYRHWDGYSATTMRHINAFRHYVDYLPRMSKKEWEQMDVYTAGIDTVPFNWNRVNQNYGLPVWMW